MPPVLLAWVLFGAAAAIALWIALRFPELAPRSGAGVTAWLGAAIVSLAGTPAALTAVGGLGGRVAAVMLVALPGGVCIMLAVAWMMLWVIRGVTPFSR